MSGTANGRKRCAGCGRILPEGSFGVKERWASDGSVRRRSQTCNACPSKLKVVVRRVDVGPLRTWLAERLAEEGLWDVAAWRPVPDHHAPRNLDEISRDWGTSAKRVQDILKMRVDTVTEDFADRLLTMAGSPHLLAILYAEPTAESVERLVA